MTAQPDLTKMLQKLSVNERASALQVALSGLRIPMDTALRMARWLDTYQIDTSLGEEMTYGGVLGQPFEDSHDEMVVVKDIDFIALCEHHLLPFHGRAAIGYIPGGLLLGLSKTARIVNWFTRHPTLQEHITANTTRALMEVVRPKGAITMLYNVEHSCMSMRGVKQRHATTNTTSLAGIFKDSAPRAEFYAMLGGSIK